MQQPGCFKFRLPAHVLRVREGTIRLPPLPPKTTKEVIWVSNLTLKQEKFVQELIKGKSQREAYRIAYPKSLKWADNTIDSRASKLFNSYKVITRYNELRDRLVKEAEDECIVSAKEVLLELKKIGFADIKNFLTFRTEKVSTGEDPETGEPLNEYTQIIELFDSDEVDGSVIQEVSLNAKGTFTFKLYDKLKALDKIGQHLGMFKELKEITGKDGGPVELKSWVDLVVKAHEGEADPPESPA
jgi:phage terminase small subunit